MIFGANGESEACSELMLSLQLSICSNHFLRYGEKTEYSGRLKTWHEFKPKIMEAVTV